MMALSKLVQALLFAALGPATFVAAAPQGSSGPSPAAKTTPAALPTVAPNNQAILQQLQLAASETDKLNVLLPNPANPANFTFTFVNNTVTSPTGGTIALSQVDNFPALDTTDLAMAIGFVNPCGLNVPHSHPRANEFLTVVQGTLTAGFLLETTEGGAGNVVGGSTTGLTGPQIQVNTTLTNYTGTIFPQGSVHFQFNPTCEPAVFAAAFDNKDPGRVQLARSFLSILPDDLTLTALGNPNSGVIDAKNLDQLRNNVPTAFAELIQSCASQCGLGSTHSTSPASGNSNEATSSSISAAAAPTTLSTLQRGPAATSTASAGETSSTAA